VFFRVQKYSDVWILLLARSGSRKISRIIEFFPNIDAVTMFPPTLQFDEECPTPPYRPASFPHIRTSFLNLSSWFPAIEADVLSRLAEASMDLDHFSIVGPMSDMSVVRKLRERETTLREQTRDRAPGFRLERIAILHPIYYRHSVRPHPRGGDMQRVSPNLRTPAAAPSQGFSSSAVEQAEHTRTHCQNNHLNHSVHHSHSLILLPPPLCTT